MITLKKTAPLALVLSLLALSGTAVSSASAATHGPVAQAAQEATDDLADETGRLAGPEGPCPGSQ